MFLTIEGIDGTGKSTQASLLSAYISDTCHHNVIRTKEPGGWEGGALLREMVTNGSLKHPWSEAYLFMLDRAEHVANVILPAIAAGSDIICERYHDSTLAYQVWGRGLPLDIFEALFIKSEFPVPDVKILLDMPVDEAMKRVKMRGNPDAFEKTGGSFMSRIRSGYLELFKREPEKWIKVDCSGSPDEVYKMICKRLKDRGYLQ
jgi:dTMP kinase